MGALQYRITCAVGCLIAPAQVLYELLSLLKLKPREGAKNVVQLTYVEFGPVLLLERSPSSSGGPMLPTQL